MPDIMTENYANEHKRDFSQKVLQVLGAPLNTLALTHWFEKSKENLELAHCFMRYVFNPQSHEQDLDLWTKLKNGPAKTMCLGELKYQNGIDWCNNFLGENKE